MSIMISAKSFQGLWLGKGYGYSLRKQIGLGPIYRNFDRWRIIGKIMYPFWYNRGPLPKTYHGEIRKMKGWLSDRLQWLDAHFSIDSFDDFGT